MVDRYCPECGCERPIETKEITEIFNVRGEQVSVSGNANVCTECDNPLGDKLFDDLIQKAYDKYRLLHGMLNAQEIKSIREGYCLTQTLFARILKIGEATLQRYERGSLPSLSLHDLIARARDRDQFLDLIEEAKGRLTEVDYKAARNAVLTSSAEQNPWRDYYSELDGIDISVVDYMQEGESYHKIFPQYLVGFLRTMSRSEEKLEGHRVASCGDEDAFSPDFKKTTMSQQDDGKGSSYDLAA